MYPHIPSVADHTALSVLGCEFNILEQDQNETFMISLIWVNTWNHDTIFCHDSQEQSQEMNLNMILSSA